MYWLCRHAVAAAFVALPVVDSFWSPVACKVRGSVPGWTSAFTSGQPRAPDELSAPRIMPLGMQGDYGDGAADRKMPAGEGYASNPGGGKPAWNPQRSFSDGFGEGIPRLNTVFLTGYLGQDPKPKYFDSGKVVLNLSLAVKREYHPIERKALGIVYGEEETDWFQLEMWNRDAEYAAKVCRKGGRVGVTGGLSLNSWIDREGNDRTTVKILVQSLELLDSRAEQAQRSDQSDANLWESERLQKSDAAAQRHQSAGGGIDVGGGTSAGALGGGAYQQQSTEDLEAKARKKAAEDKWWSAEPESPAGGATSGSGDAATAGKSGEASWWEEESAAGEQKRIDSDSLPSFFDS